jgi:hypothetical protein
VGGTGDNQPYIGELSDPQGLKVLIECPYKHPSCRWATARKPMIIKATKTHPATRFFIMAATPRVIEDGPVNFLAELTNGAAGA